MTIDEAIELQMKIAGKGSDCWKNCRNTKKHCKDCMEEHKQIAEWLEELKATKSSDIPIIHGKEELELHDKAIRNKALDDFVNACKGNTLCQTFGLRQCDIDEIAEQLKAGVKYEM